MKRDKLLKYLSSNGCQLLREGKKHSWWYNPKFNKRSSIPRHKEIVDFLAIKICKDLGVPKIK
ncbi:MAG: type II toxin-antitoxin system HicA family toxin [Candidatus Atribacteria bacterium]|nr:type II toxin-antitoxin system HicA family toxin [Candidatus Atribacteria bacterium]